MGPTPPKRSPRKPPVASTSSRKKPGKIFLTWPREDSDFRQVVLREGDLDLLKPYQYFRSKLSPEKSEKIHFLDFPLRMGSAMPDFDSDFLLQNLQWDIFTKDYIVGYGIDNESWGLIVIYFPGKLGETDDEGKPKSHVKIFSSSLPHYHHFTARTRKMLNHT